jgi:predicted CXXCH cytochrome family protein
MKEGSMTRFYVYALAVGWFIAAVMLNHAEAMHIKMDCTECHKRAKLDYQLCLKCHDRKRDTSGLNPPYSLNNDIDLSAGSFDPSNYTGHKTHQCLNCHDSHGNDNYRNLKENISGKQITVNGIGDSLYQDNIYISGMSSFCIACHQGTKDHSHPVNVRIYGSSDADYYNWAEKTSRLSIAEIPSGNVNDIADARVFCMTCHVAHGGPFIYLLRWEIMDKEGCLECHVKN